MGHLLEPGSTTPDLAILAKLGKLRLSVDSTEGEEPSTDRGEKIAAAYGEAFKQKDLGTTVAVNGKQIWTPLPLH